ncbi:lipoprotein insertase outer membrane protein LolB [Xanthomonas arboricola pv. juglandis]|uniref:lipoprotein insertase outer membrane protein LolB n=1 Tax=Xanthomonas arboricola TaxID=56448 RepID=UPI0002E57FD2|nr:lipoprotein insertase outer membrane protein LolB [Xanthomonas arboricola]KER80410.1 membrane protein [Xanthomonas arboricola pv. celebensis]MDN0221140.1 lipoprotein insertase outer membrane protein LolB [Xanthomonas arboricola pv. juglandis]MDN0225578.1 lipoprotein insertase outer membrane protein LolB [Xanthomonas arboricola pv. juglandis]MDN0229747.1 lipoprotein insertase outer membrane protein LolB [Xanthomonas arboricola pv. juglandis]MDN0234899.1 lipoprotein insertase outer membrane p
MSGAIRTLALSGLVLVGLSACVSVPRGQGSGAAVVEQVSESARQAEAARQAWLLAHPTWSFQGRVAISKGSNGGSGRIDWQQDGAKYRVQLSAPVTRQSWVLTGDTASGGGRLEGLDGGPRSGPDAEQVLLEATGWTIPVNQMPDWVRALRIADARADLDAAGRPRTVRQDGWTIDFLAWAPAGAGQPELPQRIEARNGEAKVRLLVDQWTVSP